MGPAPRYVLRDRDRVYGSRFGAGLEGLGVEQVLTPACAPRANAVAERMVGTVRRECLDHLVVVDEPHPRALLEEFTAHAHRQPFHRTLQLELPVPSARAPTGTIRSWSVLGGLHHRYDCVA